RTSGILHASPDSPNSSASAKVPDRTPMFDPAVSCHESVSDRLLHSFPTRRSSDLPPGARRSSRRSWDWSTSRTYSSATRRRKIRSEEHTSELQSRVDLVCRRLLEKEHNEALTRYLAANIAAQRWMMASANKESVIA